MALTPPPVQQWMEAEHMLPSTDAADSGPVTGLDPLLILYHCSELRSPMATLVEPGAGKMA